MAVTLATFGIALLLAGILGGGITIGKVTIPPIPTRRKRIVVWSLGAVLLVAGLYHDRFFTSDSSPDDVIPAEPIIPRQFATTMLAGRLDLLGHTDDFSDQYSNYSIRASAGPTQEFLADLDIQGRFSISVPEVPQHTVSWGVSRPTNFVIWPLTHPMVAPGERLDAFRFEPLDTVFYAQQGQMREAVAAGNFVDANERLSMVVQLSERLRFRDAATDVSVSSTIRRWLYTIRRELVQAASAFRTTVGQSAVTHQQVLIEREWWRARIDAALDQATPGQQLRDFSRTANSWANYARQVFSLNQQGAALLRRRPNQSLRRRRGRRQLDPSGRGRGDEATTGSGVQRYLCR